MLHGSQLELLYGLDIPDILPVELSVKDLQMR